MKQIKSILAVFLSLTMILAVCAVPSFGAVSAQEEAPTILVHGLNGYGPDTALAKTPVGHYWGGFATEDLAANLQKKGLRVYEASVGPISSNWDRACDLYACIKGGRVDYGAAHSKKYGHERYGRVFAGLYPEWDNDHPVNLWGHSLGSPTERVLASLLYWGDEEEQKAAPSDCSPLFQGNGKTMVNSVTTVSATNNGSTLADFAFDLLQKVTGSEAMTNDVISKAVAAIGMVAGGKISKIWDPMMDQWGLYKKDDETAAEFINRVKASGAWTTDDNCMYDMTTFYSQQLNDKFQDNPNAYYFAIPTCTTEPDSNGITQHHSRESSLLLGPLADVLGHYKDPLVPGGWDDKYYANDGMANTELAKAPFLGGESVICEWKDGTVPKRGVWYNMPVLQAEHCGAVGFYLVINQTFNMSKYYADHYNFIKSLA